MFMKTIFIIFFLLLSFTGFAQQSLDTVQTIDSNLYPDTIKYLPDSVDKRPRNIYGHLLNDDRLYNRKYAWPIPLLRVASANVFNWATSRYVFRFDWARISTQNWKDNLKYGWEWDNDRFGVNFIGHPHTGSTYFNVARSNGYSSGPHILIQSPAVLCGSILVRIQDHQKMI
jgi:hypothetical protein